MHKRIRVEFQAKFLQRVKYPLAEQVLGDIPSFTELKTPLLNGNKTSLPHICIVRIFKNASKFSEKLEVTKLFCCFSTAGRRSTTDKAARCLVLCSCPEKY